MWKKSLYFSFVILGAISCQEAEEAAKDEGQPEEVEEKVSRARTEALSSYEKLKADRNRETDEALVKLIEVLDKEKDYDAVLSRVDEYFKARALENLGHFDDAIKIYQTVVENNMGHVRRSTPSMRALCRLLWERDLPASGGKVSDRQNAFQQLVGFLGKTKSIVPKFSDEEREDWQKLAKSLKDYQPTN
jgi:tetratricopeptide (TPR) repeat protein